MYYNSSETNRLITETIKRLSDENNHNDTKYMQFMRYLLSQKQQSAITNEDVAIIALSLFGDGLNTVLE
jgi:hypothetical protein